MKTNPNKEKECCSQCIGTIANHSIEDIEKICENVDCPCHKEKELSTEEKIAGEVWREIKHEIENRGGKLPDNWDGIGSAYGSYVKLIEALSQAQTLAREEAIKDVGERVEGLSVDIRNGNGDEYVKKSTILALLTSLKEQ